MSMVVRKSTDDLYLPIFNMIGLYKGHWVTMVFTLIH